MLMAAINARKTKRNPPKYAPDPVREHPSHHNSLPPPQEKLPYPLKYPTSDPISCQFCEQSLVRYVSKAFAKSKYTASTNSP